MNQLKSILGEMWWQILIFAAMPIAWILIPKGIIKTICLVMFLIIYYIILGQNVYFESSKNLNNLLGGFYGKLNKNVSGKKEN